MTSTTALLSLIFFLASPFLSLAGEPVHLFLLSGQSNMANLNPGPVFTPQIQQHFGADNVVIVKVAKSGQPIRRWHQGWKLTGAQNPKQIGDIYEELMKQTKTALNGRPIESVTLVWMQGERDAKEGLSDHYQEAFQGLLDQIKTELKIKNLNYVMGRLSDSGLGNKDWDRMRDIQQKLGEAGPHAAWVNTDDLNGETNDLHYTKEGYQLLAERFASRAIELLKHSKPEAKQP